MRNNFGNRSGAINRLGGRTMSSFREWKDGRLGEATVTFIID